MQGSGRSARGEPFPDELTAPPPPGQIPRPRRNPGPPTLARDTLRIPPDSPAVRRLRALVHRGDADTVRAQVEVARVPAPSFAEAARAEWVAARMAESGLAAVHRDEAGNVLARLPGSPEGPEDAVVLAAHLDTVFPAGTDLSPREAGGRVYAPGITDNARGLAGMLAMARVLATCGTRTRRPLLFAATVGEEGIGDLAGVKHLFREGSGLRGAYAFVALDGSGVRRIVHRAIGSRRLRLTITGPGGHSWADRGAPNPAHVLGRAIAAVAGITLPSPGRSSLTVTRLAGGTSVNTVPRDAWMELDLRSEAPGALAEIEAAVRRHADAALAAENTRRRGSDPPLAAAVELIGDRPSGETPREHPLVRTASEVTVMLGEKPELVASSTDANLPISLGIPAIAIGIGGDSGGIHTTEEWYSNEKGALGVERALLIALAAAEWVE